MPWINALVFVPWLFGPWTNEIFVLPKMLAAAMMLAVGFVAWLGRGREAPVLDDRVESALGLCALVLILSAALSPDPWSAWLGEYRDFTWGVLGFAFYWLVLKASAGQSQGDRPGKLLRWVVLSSVPVSIYAWLQALRLDPLDLAMNQNGPFRAVSTIGGWVQLGSYLMMCVPLCLELSVSQDKQRQWEGRVVLILSLAGLWACRTRSAWIGAAAGGALWLFLRDRGRVKTILNKKRAGVLGAFGLALLVLVLWLDRADSDLERVELWKSAWRMFLDHPWLGASPGAFASVFRAYKTPYYAAVSDFRFGQADAHNDWLHILAGAGVLGALAYAFLHFAFWRVWKDNDDRAWWRPAFLGALFSLWIQLKMNAGGWTPFFMAAILAGPLLARPAGARNFKRKARDWLSVGAALGVLFICVYLAWADRAALLGWRFRGEGRPREAALHFEQAMALNPWEIHYRFMACNLLWDAVSAVESLDERGLILDRTLQIGLEAVRYRPLHPDAYYLLGLSELKAYELSGRKSLERAIAAFEAALRLDPEYGLLKKDHERAMALRAGRR